MGVAILISIAVWATQTGSLSQSDFLPKVPVLSGDISSHTESDVGGFLQPKESLWALPWFPAQLVMHGYIESQLWALMGARQRMTNSLPAKMIRSSHHQITRDLTSTTMTPLRYSHIPHNKTTCTCTLMVQLALIKGCIS